MNGNIRQLEADRKRNILENTNEKKKIQRCEKTTNHFNTSFELFLIDLFICFSFPTKKAGNKKYVTWKL